MSILAWLLVGFVAGALAGMATGSRDRGCLGTIAVGIIGALLGGWLFRVGTGEDEALTGFNLVSVLVAFVGAAVLLLILQVLGVDDRRRRR